MVFVNEKGGFHKTLTVTQNSFSESLTVLKNPFLKKTENYSISVTDFYINKSPSLFLDEGVVLEIKQYDTFLGGFPPHILPKHRQFTPKNCYSVQEFIRQLQNFFHEFGNLILSRGYQTDEQPDQLPGFPDIWKVYKNTDTAIVHDGFENTDFVKKHLLYNAHDADGADIGFQFVGWDMLYKNGHIVQVKLTSDNLVQFILSPGFSYNFYIELSEKMSARLGLPIRIHGVHTMEIGFILTYLETDIVTVAGDFVDEVDDRVEIASNVIRESLNSISALDERISIDLWATFPVSSKIFARNGIEGREFILSRFPLNETNYFRTELTTFQDNSEEITLTEGFISGLQNLTKGNHGYESNHFLNGDIRSVHLQLYTQYRELTGIQRVKTDMTDGIWSVTMKFSKKL